MMARGLGNPLIKLEPLDTLRRVSVMKKYFYTQRVLSYFPVKQLPAGHFFIGSNLSSRISPNQPELEGHSFSDS